MDWTMGQRTTRRAPSAAKSTLAPASRASVRRAGLRFVTDTAAGISRERRGGGFRYLGPTGRPVHTAAVLRRISRIVIPPAWKRVWICRDARGHIQATGFDARGRKQYRYHADWTLERESRKFDDLTEFARVLPRIREQVRRDLRRTGLPRERVLAAVVYLMERTLIRVGNDQYARTNGSYGATTLRKRHVSVRGERVRIEFAGKSGVAHEISVRDSRLSHVVASCQELPGQDLFEYLSEDGTVCRVRSNDVNDYLREISGSEFTAKEFRTWAGTVLAARALAGMDSPKTATAARRNIVEAVREVAAELGNTAAVCRKSYIHPTVLDAYAAGRLSNAPPLARPRSHPAGLSREERWILRTLKNGKKRTR